MKVFVAIAMVSMAIAGSASADSLSWAGAGKRLSGSPVGDTISAEKQQLAQRDYLLRKGLGIGTNTYINQTSNTVIGCLTNDTTTVSVYDQVNGINTAINKSNNCTVTGDTTGNQSSK